MTDLNVMQAISQRRAVRAYLDSAVTEEQIRALLEAAVRAPTAVHEEPWAFVIIQDKSLLRQLSDRAKAIALRGPARDTSLADLLRQPEFNVFYDASTLIVICARPRTEFVAADCWLAAENLMLAACGMGLGTCVIGFAVAALQSPEIKADLGIPAEVTPIAPIIVGVPNGTTPPTSRRPPDILAWKR